MKHIEVVAGIIEKDNKILCMQRDKGKQAYTSFKWEFPGGKIENRESKEEALKRELLEEMELEVDIIKPFCEVHHTYPDFTITMYCYLCKAISKDFKLNVHKDFKWLSKSDLKSLDWAEADLPVVNKLINYKDLDASKN